MNRSKNNIQDQDWSLRYPNNWAEISWKCRESTNFQCCLCGDGATQTHHALYTYRDGKVIADFRGIGSYLFPLCNDCHQIAHHPFNYRKDSKNPVLGNKNSPRFYKLLRDGWLKSKVVGWNQNVVVSIQ